MVIIAFACIVVVFEPLTGIDGVGFSCDGSGHGRESIEIGTKVLVQVTFNDARDGCWLLVRPFLKSFEVLLKLS